MLFSMTLYLALAIFILGTLYRIIRWFTVKIGPDAGQFTFRARVLGVFKSCFTVLFSRNIFRIVNAFFFRILFQGHILIKDPWRWLMHFSIFVGFLLLVLFHAMDDLISVNLFYDYYPTVNPFLFLRNLCGAMVVFGIVIAGVRRLTSKGLKKISTSQDMLALVLLSIILITGFMLEGSKIISEPIFDEMVEDYGDSEDADALEALQSFWAKNYGVVFAAAPDLMDADLLEAGRHGSGFLCR